MYYKENIAVDEHVIIDNMSEWKEFDAICKELDIWNRNIGSEIGKKNGDGYVIRKTYNIGNKTYSVECEERSKWGNELRKPSSSVSFSFWKENMKRPPLNTVSLYGEEVVFGNMGWCHFTHFLEFYSNRLVAAGGLSHWKALSKETVEYSLGTHHLVLEQGSTGLRLTWMLKGNNFCNTRPKVDYNSWCANNYKKYSNNNNPLNTPPAMEYDYPQPTIPCRLILESKADWEDLESLVKSSTKINLNGNGGLNVGNREFVYYIKEAYGCKDLYVVCVESKNDSFSANLPLRTVSELRSVMLYLHTQGAHGIDAIAAHYQDKDKDGNPINSQSNTSPNGKTVEVRRITPLVLRGEVPSGHTVQGRRSKIAIESGHLGFREVQS